MKRIVLIIIFWGICSFYCIAQYNNNYTPFDYAIAAAMTDEVYKLNNIRFDENALSQNPEAWNEYQKYLRIDSYYAKKSKTYNTIGWIGVGVTCTSLIPLIQYCNYDYDDPRQDAALGWSVGLLCAGGITTLVGYIGAIVQLDKLKINKKDFIYYLKTTNNGVGIVTIF